MADQPRLDDVTIESAAMSDMRAGATVFARAMGREEPAIVERLLAFSMNLLDSGIGRFVVARHRSRTVGYGSLAAYRTIGWIGFMGTDPDLQGRGIGAAIMNRLLESANRLNLLTLNLDATNIGMKLYSKFGFRVLFPACRFGIPGQCTRGTHRETHGGRVRILDSLPEWCAAFDMRAFGDDRSPLIRNALRHGGKVLVVEERAFGLIEGKKLGPVVAADRQAAEDILRRASDLGADVVYVSEHPSLARKFLAGLKPPDQSGPITCCTRMTRGRPVEQDLKLVYGDYSAATG
jgi:GNAT superfamily N-acetyltransferase